MNNCADISTCPAVMTLPSPSYMVGLSFLLCACAAVLFVPVHALVPPASSESTPPRGLVLSPDPSLPAPDQFGSMVAWQPQWGVEDVNASQSERQMARLREWSNKPLKGWNSCGAFFWSVSEEEMMANIDLTAKLLQPAGYNIIELGQHC